MVSLSLCDPLSAKHLLGGFYCSQGRDHCPILTLTNGTLSFVTLSKLRLACHFYEGMHWLQYPPLKRTWGSSGPLGKFPAIDQQSSWQQEKKRRRRRRRTQAAPSSHVQGHEMQPLFIAVSQFSVQWKTVHKCSDSCRLFLPAVVELVPQNMSG